MARTDYTYIGVGKVYFREKGAAKPLIEMGNVTKLNLGVEEDVIEQKDYTSGGGGTLNEVRRVKGVNASMTLTELRPENVALLLFGTASAANAGSVTAEAVVAYVGGLSRLAHVNPTSVVVKNEAGSTTYDLGDDYEVRTAGIFIPAGSAIQGGDTIKVDYSYGAEDVIQALTQSAKDYEMAFDGVNEAQSGKPFVVDLHRVKFGAAKSLDLIGDNFGSFEITGKVLKDANISGAGVSQFFKATSAV